MGKKYIIELLDDCQSEFKGILTFGVTQEKQISIELIPEEDLTPYTEPDLEQVRKEAYDSGYDDAKGGYENGFENGMIVAWDAARKIQEMDIDTLHEIFGWVAGKKDVFIEYTATEAIERLKQFEQKQEESKKEQSVTAEDVMRQYLNEFCKKHRCSKDCVLNTDDFTCGRGNHFTTDSPVSDEEVRRAYAKVVKER